MWACRGWMRRAMAMRAGLRPGNSPIQSQASSPAGWKAPGEGGNARHVCTGSTLTNNTEATRQEDPSGGRTHRPSHGPRKVLKPGVCRGPGGPACALARTCSTACVPVTPRPRGQRDPLPAFGVATTRGPAGVAGHRCRNGSAEMRGRTPTYGRQVEPRCPMYPPCQGLAWQHRRACAHWAACCLPDRGRSVHEGTATPSTKHGEC